MTPSTRLPKVAIVGPCAAGKSTLAAGLRRFGYPVKEVVQEHSFVPHLWSHFYHPDFLIYLDASHATGTRRKHLDWLEAEHAEQVARLAHARRHCHLYLPTDELTREQVLERALEALGWSGPSGV